MESLEAFIKIRDGNKWKKRFCVLQNPTPSGTLSEVVLLNVYKNVKFTRKPGPKGRVHRIEGFCGLESGFVLDKESRTLAIICRTSVFILAFDSDFTLHNWELWLRNSFGHGCQYSVYIVDAPSTMTSIRNTNARLHLRDHRVCLTIGSPPRLALELQFRYIRQFGAMENKFRVEAGTRTGPLAGVYVFRTGHIDQMSITFNLAAVGNLHKYLSSNLNSTNEPSLSSEVVYGSVGNALSNGRQRVVGDRSMDSSQSAQSSWNSDSRPLLRSISAKGAAIFPNEMRFGAEDGLGDVGAMISVSVERGGEPSQPYRPCHRSGSEIYAKRLPLPASPKPTSNAPGSSSTQLGNPIHPNYVNQGYLNSLECYYNAEHVVSVPSVGAKDNDAPMPGYLAMAPRGSVYERMNPSFNASPEKPLSNIGEDEIDGGNSNDVSSGLFVKPFEPLILRKQRSGTIALTTQQSVPSDWRYNAGYNNRKLSLPATLMMERPMVSVPFERRFSLEEQRQTSRSDSPMSAISVGGSFNGLRSKAASRSRDVLRSTSDKAKLWFGSLLRRKTSAVSNEMDDDELRNDDGRESRARSEPFEEIEPERRFENSYVMDLARQISQSSLDLDEVVYDVATSSTAQQVPMEVLKRIGIKPLVPETPSQNASVKLPIGPILSNGTGSTRSSDSISAAAMNDPNYDRASIHDSVSVGSDNSDTDSVFTNRAVRRKHHGRNLTLNSAKVQETVHTGKVLATHASAIRELPKPPLEPPRLSVDDQRRLRENLTKPLTGSYSRYDGDGSCDSPLMSPSVLPALDRNLASSNSKRSAILNRHMENTSSELHGNNRRRVNEVPKPIAVLLKANVVPAPAAIPNGPRFSPAHSPSPPPELAPPPPIVNDPLPFRRASMPVAPRSALPRLEGHVFKFPPPPGQQLNYAMLAAQDDRMPTTPTSDGGESCRTPRTAHIFQLGNKESETEGAVEYAKIDLDATRAAREVLSSRREDIRNRSSSTHALSSRSESPHAVEKNEPSTSNNSGTMSKSRRPFSSLKRSLIRRRTSMASLAGF